MLVIPPVCRKSKSIVLLLAITAIAAAGLFAGLARAEDDNKLPAIATPSNTFIKYLFPKDTTGKLTFPTAPVTDPDADDTPTVKFTFKFDDADATEIAKKPDEMLLAVHFDETNHTYEFSKSSAYTIEKYRDVYNTTGAQTTLDGTMTADDSTDTAELSFTLTVQHDASAQFQTPATHQSNNRWQVSTTYEVYEGPSAADAIPHLASQHTGRQTFLVRGHRLRKPDKVLRQLQQHGDNCLRRLARVSRRPAVLRLQHHRRYGNHPFRNTFHRLQGRPGLRKSPRRRQGPRLHATHRQRPRNRPPGRR